MLNSAVNETHDHIFFSSEGKAIMKVQFGATLYCMKWKISSVRACLKNVGLYFIQLKQFTVCASQSQIRDQLCPAYIAHEFQVISVNTSHNNGDLLSLKCEIISFVF
ncbi:hypothetical protein ILYODFUR_024523 [Ilyodon furcidens]|uniref:Uncharacterized protein n=1 Tax=Ilyodon furcidens TaxID=33524 RepID=A0ABV0SQA4_9TELE